MKYPFHLVRLLLFCTLAIASMTSCRTSAGGTAPAASDVRSLVPERVDIRGSIFSSRYDQGQVMLEVEGFPSPDSRYSRAYVLVLPTVQIINPDGKTISLSELRTGQTVDILLRGGGRGNLMGVGVARKIWLEEAY